MRILLSLIMLLSCLEIFAQESDSSLSHADIYQEEVVVDGKVRPTLNIEFLGKAPLFGSVSYEHNFNRNYGIGIGLGVGNIATGTITRVLDDSQMTIVTEDGRYLDVAASVPVYLIAKQGKGKHRIVEQLGFTTLVTGYFNKYPSGHVDKGTEAFGLPFASIGYEYEGRRMVFRVPLYLGYLGKNSGIFPSFVPWGGVSLGIKLGKQ
jgi:hypothetical protein